MTDSDILKTDARSYSQVRKTVLVNKLPLRTSRSWLL